MSKTRENTYLGVGRSTVTAAPGPLAVVRSEDKNSLTYDLVDGVKEEKDPQRVLSLCSKFRVGLHILNHITSRLAITT